LDAVSRFISDLWFRKNMMRAEGGMTVFGVQIRRAFSANAARKKHVPKYEK